MPTIIPINPIPNQALTIRLVDSRYVLVLKEAGGVMAASIERDGAAIVSGMRCVAGTPVLPYRYLWEEFGNFIFTGPEDGTIPYYEQFGTEIFLVFSTPAEIAAAVDNG